MTDDGTITNRILLEHIQAGDNSLREELRNLKTEMKEGFQRVDGRMNRLEEKVDRGFADIHYRLEQARVHREAIQEDLDATIRKQAIHDRKLAMVTGGPLPEDFY